MSDLGEREEEAELLELANAGDPAAWQKLTASLRERVLPTVLPLVKNNAEAEDVLQETFLAVYRDVGNFRGKSRVLTWVWTIAKRKALERLRDQLQDRKALETRTTEVAVHTGMHESPVTPEQAAINSESRAILAQAVQSLRPADQAVLTKALERGEDNTSTQGPATNKERVALFRARQNLREAMLKLEGKEDDR